jgi:hypothetical protein
MHIYTVVTQSSFSRLCSIGYGIRREETVKPSAQRSGAPDSLDASVFFPKCVDRSTHPVLRCALGLSDVAVKQGPHCGPSFAV